MVAQYCGIKNIQLENYSSELNISLFINLH